MIVFRAGSARAVLPKRIDAVIRHGQRISCRLLSSQKDKSNDDGDFRFPLNFAGLGLESRLVYPYLGSIQQLPEIQTALQDISSPEAIEKLKRGVEVFEMMQKGGHEHIAALAILAEVYNRQGRHDRVYSTLTEQLKPLVHAGAASFDLSIASAKNLWHMGDFAQAESCCNELLQSDQIDDLPIHNACAMTGLALSRLLQCQTLDDAFSVRDPFRIVVKFLERNRQYGIMPLAAANLNYGVSEATYNDVVARINDVTMPMNSTLKAWNSAISLIKDSGGSEKKSVIANSLHSRLESNMAWGILRVEGMHDNLKKASEFGGKALSTCDKNEEEKDNLCRVLSIVAECCVEAEQAVTAEGLYQSAVDSKNDNGSVFAKLQLRDACKGYAKLCKQWEKREADAAKMEQRANQIDESLPDGWKGKLGIHSTLWFWTPNLFVR